MVSEIESGSSSSSAGVKDMSCMYRPCCSPAEGTGRD